MAMDRETQVLNAAVAAGITSPRELANFMAQTTHESLGLNRLEEGFRYTKGIEQIPVRAAWRHGAVELEQARKEALQGKPEHLAELMYGGRNGNDHPGDGYAYHGRGYIQLTGKENYRAAGEALQLDLVKHPELASQPENAAKIAVWYWQNRVPEAARDNVRDATLAVNGGLNGLKDREARFQQWEHKLTPEVMERLITGQAGQPHPSHDVTHAHAAPHGEHTPQPEQHQDVRRLQQLLNEHGYRDENGRPLKVDGHAGMRTHHAIEVFQREQQLKVDGVAGPLTLQRLETIVQQSKHEAPQLNQPGHPGHAMYGQAIDAVTALDKQYQRAPDERSANLAAALTTAARQQGLSRIDHVVLNEDGQRAYAVQGDLNSPFKRTAEVSTLEAATTPIARSSVAWNLAAPPSVAAPAEPSRDQATRQAL